MLEEIICEIEAHGEAQDGTKMIALIGAGGKTTLLYALAEAFAKQGKKTLVTTTTHIYKPTDASVVENIEQCHRRWKLNTYAVVGTEGKHGKLKALNPNMLAPYIEEADVVLVEADGAKGMPCKVSNATEPVLLADTTMVLMVLGLDALGRRLRDACFRCELAMDLLGEERDHVINEHDFVTIIRNQLEEKLDINEKKCMVILNKCDTKKRQLQGEKILKVLEQDGRYRGYLTTFR